MRRRPDRIPAAFLVILPFLVPFPFVLPAAIPAAAAEPPPAVASERPEPAVGPLPAAVSLVEAVRLAVSRSWDVRQSVADVGIAVQERIRAEAGRLPRVDAAADFVSYSEPPALLIQGREVQSSDQSIFRARAQAEQTIYDFGRTRARIEGARAGVAAAESRSGLTRERQAFDAIAAFLGARRAEEIRSVAEESLATARAYRKVAGDLYDQGVVARNDVLAADVQVANAEAALIAAENEVELSRSRLALQLGYSGARTAVPEPGPFPVPEGPEPTLPESIETAWKEREEARVQEALVREGEAAAGAARAAFYPSFHGQGAYSYETNDFNPNESVFTVLLTGRMNLFAGFADEAALREARLVVERRRDELARLRDRIALDVKAARLAVSEAMKRMRVAETAVERSEENLRIQDLRYKEGLAISTEVLDAQTLLTRAKVDLRNAAFDLHEARYRVLLSRGELLDFFTPWIGGEGRS